MKTTAIKKSYFSAKIVYKSLLMSGCFLCTSTLATNTLFPNYPGVTLTGVQGSNGGLTGYADALAPIFGNDISILYLDPQGLYHNSNEYAGSLGFGWRQMVNADNIVGAYVFGDYNHSPNNNSFWFISPGVERLGNTFDLSANLYIPVSSQEANANSVFGDQIDIFNNVRFQGHTQYDEIYTQKKSVGIGADAEIGYRLPFRNNTKVYLGGYYFNPKNTDSITGGTVKLEVPFSKHLSTFLSDGYDNVMHNTIKFGMSFSFGGRTTGYDTANTTLQDRMLDPIHRNLASTNSGWQANQPITLSAYMPTDISGAELNNISFFQPIIGPNPKLTSPDGSYENPYIGFNQANVDLANTANNNNLYINTGTYNNTNATNLTNDNVYGRMNYNSQPFGQPASGSNRPLINFTGSGGFNLLGNNTLNDLQLVGPNTSGNNGISFSSVPSDSTPLTNNLNDISVSNFDYGFLMYNSQGSKGDMNLFVDNSTFNNNLTGGMFIHSLGNDNMNANITNSQFNSNGSNITHAGLSIKNAVDSYATINVNINNSTFNNNQGDGLTAFTGYAVPDNTFINLNIDNSTIDHNTGNGVNITAQDPQNSVINAVITNSNLTNNGSYGVFGTAASVGKATITLLDNFFSGNTAGDTNQAVPGNNVIWNGVFLASLPAKNDTASADTHKDDASKKPTESTTTSTNTDKAPPTKPVEPTKPITPTTGTGNDASPTKPTEPTKTTSPVEPVKPTTGTGNNASPTEPVNSAPTSKPVESPTPINKPTSVPTIRKDILADTKKDAVLIKPIEKTARDINQNTPPKPPVIKPRMPTQPTIPKDSLAFDETPLSF